ncbi:hypothetical protein IscW_ISCW017882 [Ixodes scapularis]|uniref:Uncharacterized protein n=1 Tax=Ixodes scapularis TaxID=6945 RepID=B7PIY3_IXOSC|nr:hypothetical protein IscW_ISCW017882 [Ixodes scapularis]|eukprot:XP_002406612.1 hypothetical protein IscW_ISCW017882 [Ixodes scapularis]
MNHFQCSMQYAQVMILRKTHSTVIFHSQNQEKQNYQIFLHHSSVTPWVPLQTLLHSIHLSDPRRRPTHISPDVLRISTQHPQSVNNYGTPVRCYEHLPNHTRNARATLMKSMKNF